MNIKFKKLNLLLCCLVVIVLCSIFTVSSAYADQIAVRKAKKETIDKEKHKEVLQKIDRFLSGFDTMYSKFVESSPPYGNINKGIISISRPGKIKVEYITPDKSVVIIKDNKVVYYDKELDTVSYGKVDSNPLQILLYKKISLFKDLRITDIIDSNNTLEVQISPEIPSALRDDFSEFISITLIFQKDPMKLVRIKRTDVNNHSINIRLINPKYNVIFADDAFPYSNPRRDTILKNKMQRN